MLRPRVPRPPSPCPTHCHASHNAQTLTMGAWGRTRELAPMSLGSRAVPRPLFLQPRRSSLGSPPDDHCLQAGRASSSSLPSCGLTGGPLGSPRLPALPSRLRPPRIQDVVTRIQDAVTQMPDAVTRIQDAVTRMLDVVTWIQDTVTRVQDVVTRMPDAVTQRSGSSHPPTSRGACAGGQPLSPLLTTPPVT